LKATSVRGSVLSQVSFAPDKHGKQDHPPKFGKSLFGTVGKGTAKVELYSFSGTIKIMVRDLVAP
jgi:cytochrome c2